MAAQQLPEDMIVEIIARLPVKSLIRFRSVCKPWQARIKSPDFADHHLSLLLSLSARSSAASSFLTLVHLLNPDPMMSFVVTVDRDSGVALTKEVNLPDVGDGCGKVVALLEKFYAPEVEDGCRRNAALLGCGCGGCGVYCVAERLADIAMIWNPATREARRVPRCSDGDKNLNCKLVAFSCCVDREKRVRDFKLMRLVYVEGAYALKIYTMSTDSWSSAAECRIGLCYDAVWKLLMVQGVVNLSNVAHWVVCLVTGPNAILFFDFGVESFGLIAPPEALMDSAYHVSVTSFDGRFLCLIELGRETVEVWVMREYGIEESWVRHAVVPVGVGDEFHHRNWYPNWSAVKEDENGIYGLFSEVDELYFCSKAGFRKIWIGKKGRSRVRIAVGSNANNVESLVSLEQQSIAG